MPPQYRLAAKLMDRDAVLRFVSFLSSFFFFFFFSSSFVSLAFFPLDFVSDLLLHSEAVLVAVN
jgi:hypothetical protein